MRYPTRGYQCDPPSTLLLRRPQGIHVPMPQAKTNLVIDRESHISICIAQVAARRYFEKSIDQNGEPETVTIDKSGANLAALDALNAERETPIRIRQNKYLNNVIEQDHRAIKRRTRPMLGFKNFRCARILLSGIELMHMIAKGQMEDNGIGYTRAEQFYSLAA
jgi:putative transposase